MPIGDSQSSPIGRYWRCALVVFFNYGLDTGTVWKTAPFHKPILWRHVSWEQQSPDREVKQRSPWGWLFYRRVKTGKAFYRPMNRTVHTHIKSIMPDNPDPAAPVFVGGSTRPNILQIDRTQGSFAVVGVDFASEARHGSSALIIFPAAERGSASIRKID